MVVRTISLNVPDQLLKASGRHSAALRLTRAAYIRKAIERLNERMETEFRIRRMRRASQRCRDADLKVNAEFAAIEHHFED